MKEVYEVTFSDGRKAHAGREHVWVVCHDRFRDGKVMQTKEIVAELQKPCMARRLWVPLASGDFGASWREEIDPWLLGLLIGDGGLSRSSVYLSSADAEIIERVASVLPAGVTIKKASKYDYRLTAAKGSANPLRDCLASLGLMGCLSSNKRIPGAVFLSDKATRKAVLQGLMDADGWVEKNGTCQISVSNRLLANDIQQLVFSIGGLGRISTKKTKGLDAYTVRVRLATTADLFGLQRKRDRCVVRKKQPRLTIEKIELIGREESTCIMVTHPSHTYLTNNYVVTHNTVFAMNICAHVALAGTPVGVWSLEMSDEELMQRMACAQAGIPSVVLQRPRLLDSVEEAMPKLNAAIKALRDAPLYISDRTDVTIEQIEAQARQMHASGKLELLCIDYLGLLRLPKMDRHDLSIAHVTRRVKIIAKELKIPVLLVFQLNRGSESAVAVRAPRPSDARDSGAIEQDLDVMFLLHRPSEYDTKAAKGLRLHLALQRNGPTGLIRLDDVLHQCRFTGGTHAWEDPQQRGGKDNEL